MGTVGDLDGDGLSDFFVASAGWLNATLQPLGQVCAYSGITAKEIRCWNGEQGYSGFGNTTNANDVNGDGIPDLIISAGYYDFQRGRVYLFSGANEDLLYYWDGPNENQWFGFSVSGGFDIDGDTVPDIVVGEPGFDSPEIEFAGKVYVFSGATKRIIRTWMGDSPADHFGRSVALLKDFDGDGAADVLIGAPWNGSGKAYIFSGATGEQIWFRQGDEIGGHVFGAAVASVGDVNGDGLTDFAIGDYYHDGPSEPFSSHGQVQLFVSPDGEVLHTWVGEAWDDFLGFTVAGAGDVSGDGVPDIITGAYSHDGPAGWNSGKAYVFSGASGHLLWQSTGEGGLDLFGALVGSAGDTDGDGRAEVIVGAYYHDGIAGADSGRAYVFSPVTVECDCDEGTSLNDFARYSFCLAGVGEFENSPACYCSDFDADEDTDLRDFEAFQLRFSSSP